MQEDHRFVKKTRNLIKVPNPMQKPMAPAVCFTHDSIAIDYLYIYGIETRATMEILRGNV